ncbi:DUF732 domain-containing protein [Kitasatospora sp. NPDC002040]|uniref:DUF732 domain-containing protein n=1 Tax=Kitasatospora sp. NPDC002040 TaxID=3154661 RepID=UPI0033175177
MRLATRIIGTALLAGLTLTGCNSASTTSSSPKGAFGASQKSEAPKAESPAPAPAQSSTAPKPASAIPSPDAAQTAVLVATLKAVNPALVEKTDKAVDRARNVCSDVQAGKDAATVAKNAKSRFEGGAVTLTDAQALAIVEAVKASFCK